MPPRTVDFPVRTLPAPRTFPRAPGIGSDRPRSIGPGTRRRAERAR
jgi:hypothetical protein